MDKWILAARFHYATDIAFILFKIELTKREIPFIVKDEHTVSVDPLVSLGVGGIKIYTQRNSIIKAKRILDHILNSEEE